MAPNAEHLKLLRIVVREDFSRHRSEMLIKDITMVLGLLDKLDAKAVQAQRYALVFIL